MILALAGAFTSGCALQTTQLAPSSAAQLQAERLVWKAPANASATIRVVRDVGFSGGGCFFGLFVNKQLAARMAPGEVIDLPVVPGELVLGVGRDPQGRGLCGTFFDSDIVNRETMIASGETKHFRMVMGPQGIDIRRSDF